MNGKLAIETHEGFVVAESLNDIALEEEDEVAGNLNSLGHETLKHIESGENFDVFIEDIHMGQENAFAFVTS